MGLVSPLCNKHCDPFTVMFILLKVHLDLGLEQPLLLQRQQLVLGDLELQHRQLRQLDLVLEQALLELLAQVCSQVLGSRQLQLVMALFFCLLDSNFKSASSLSHLLDSVCVIF